MAYLFQTFSLNAVLTSPQMNQVEVNIRDHQHGVAGVSDAVLAKSAAIITVANATETSLFAPSVPGGTLATFNSVRMRIKAEFLQNTGSNRTLTTRIKWGGTLYETRVDTIASNASRGGYDLEVVLSARNAATGTQFLEYTRTVADPGVLSGAGVLVSPVRGMNITLNKDSTLAQTLEVTIQQSVTDPLMEFVKHYAVLEVWR